MTVALSFKRLLVKCLKGAAKEPAEHSVAARSSWGRPGDRSLSFVREDPSIARDAPTIADGHIDHREGCRRTAKLKRVFAGPLNGCGRTLESDDDAVGSLNFLFTSSESLEGPSSLRLVGWGECCQSPPAQ